MAAGIHRIDRDGHAQLALSPVGEQSLRPYAGVGHRSHLDRRYWISIELGADVPADEVARLVDGSYKLVCETLTRKERAELAELKR